MNHRDIHVMIYSNETVSDVIREKVKTAANEMIVKENLSDDMNTAISITYHDDSNTSSNERLYVDYAIFTPGWDTAETCLLNALTCLFHKQHIIGLGIEPLHQKDWYILDNEVFISRLKIGLYSKISQYTKHD